MTPLLIAALGLLPLGLTGAAASVPMIAFLLVLQGLGQGLVNIDQLCARGCAMIPTVEIPY